MRRVPAVLAMVALLAAAPDAAVAAEGPGRPPDQQVLRSAGVQVTWPLRQSTTTLAPRASVRVVIRRAANAERRAPVRIALTRISRSGRVMRVVAVRRIRAGIFAPRLTEPPGSRYRLSLVVAGRWFWGLIDTVAPPAAHPGPNVTCQAAGLAPPDARLTLDRPAARPGEPVTTTVHNAGDNCLTAGYASEYQRLMPDGSWYAIPSGPFTALALVVRAGEQVSTPAPVPADAAPGHYRVRKTVATMAGDVGFSAEIYAELDVTP
jgi:hypothetical protein